MHTQVRSGNLHLGNQPLARGYFVAPTKCHTTNMCTTNIYVGSMHAYGVIPSLTVL